MQHIEQEDHYDDRDVRPDNVMNPAMTVIELKEFGIKYHAAQKTNIRFIGMKYLINSLTAINKNVETFRDPLIVPWINNAGSVKGSQLMIKRGEEERNGIRLLDQDLNTLYQYQNETIQFGTQKVMLNKDNQEDYMIVVSV